MGDSQTITGMVLAGLAIVAALGTLVLMVMLQKAIARETAARNESVRKVEHRLT